jgi:hypothetical protein
MRDRTNKARILLLVTDGGAKVFAGETLIVKAGAEDNVVFDDHAFPKIDRVDKGWQAKKEEVRRRRIGADAKGCDLSLEMNSALQVE